MVISGPAPQPPHRQVLLRFQEGLAGFHGTIALKDSPAREPAPYKESPDSLEVSPGFKTLSAACLGEGRGLC